MTEPDAEPTEIGGISNYILSIIYGSVVVIALSVGGALQLYKFMHPETPAQQLTRAVDALGSGDEAIARRVLQRLAANGNAEAEYWLADLTERAHGTLRDMGTAVSLYEAASAKGSVPAQVRLGEIYLSGIEVDPDYGRAMDLLSKAAAAQNGTAQRLLGQMYAVGLGGPRDPFKAAVFCSAAVMNGDRLAVPERNSLMSELNPDQIAQIQSEIGRLGLVKQG